MFPSSAEKKRPVETIKAVNALYEATVKNDPQITVIDTWTLFANPEGDATDALVPGQTSSQSCRIRTLGRRFTSDFCNPRASRYQGGTF